MLRALAAAVATTLLASAPAAAQTAPSQIEAPSLWTIAGPGGPVHLFGSMHLLPEGIAWRTPAFDAAFKQAETVVLEIDFDAAQNPQQAQGLIAKYGLLPQGRTLREVLPEKLAAELDRTGADLGIPAGSLAPFRPWLAAVTLAIQFIVKQGFDPARGVDVQIAGEARATGKRLAALETPESQIRIFADLPRDQEQEFLAVSLRQIRETPQMLGELTDAYRKGDFARLDEILNLGLDETPGLRQRILADRHAKWLPQLQRMIASGDAHLVVVGAAHLVGPDSLVAMLRAKGIKVDGP
jgi:hypothetical protein